MSAAEMTALTRAAAVAWVEREERATGSKMVAYEVVAQTVGTSSSWLRKFIKGDEAKQPNWVVGWNILHAYRAICQRIENAAERERETARALERKIDAATSSNLGLVARASTAEAHREEDPTA